MIIVMSFGDHIGNSFLEVMAYILNGFVSSEPKLIILLLQVFDLIVHLRQLEINK